MTTKSATTQERQSVGDEIRDAVTDLRTRSDAFERQVRAFLGERPLLALAGAVAAGFVVARVLARRT
jgi:hypothetical protein